MYTILAFAATLLKPDNPSTSTTAIDKNFLFKQFKKNDLFFFFKNDKKRFQNDKIRKIWHKPSHSSSPRNARP